MEKTFKGLDAQTQLLIGIGAAVASGCIPCLEKMTAMAEEAGIDRKKLKAAAIVGQFVKDQPASHMKEAADRLVGTHLQASVSTNNCTMSSGKMEKERTKASSQGCCG